MSLSRRERRILSAVGDALLPRGGRPLPAASDVATAHRAAELIADRVDRAVVGVLRAALWSLELSTIATRGRAFTRLSPRDRERIVAGATSSGSLLRRGRVDLMKHVLVNTYLSQREVADALGFDRAGKLDRCEAVGPLPPVVRLSPRTWPEIPEVVRCDAVIVGSGAGGGPVAAVLAEAGLDVVVVEEGGYHDRTDFRAEGPWERFLDLYRDAGLTGTLGRPPIPVPLGRAVGGTTVVNAGTCFRAPDAVLRRWSRELGLEDVGPGDLAPIFDEVEQVQSVGIPSHGVLGRNAEVFREGLLAMCGDEGEPLDRNQRGCRGCGESVVGCPFDAKQAVHLTWLPRAERAGARIFARTRVERVVHRDGRVFGVEATALDPQRGDRPRGPVRVESPVVVVSAGALHTPVLLDRSGVPDPSGLRGRNLQIHPAIGIAAEMPEAVRAWEGVLQSWGSDALLAEHGIMIEATAAPPPLTGGQSPFTGRPLKQLIGAGERMATTGFLIEDSTTGRVRRGPAGRPLATYQLTDADERRIALGFAWCAEALLEAGAERVLVGRPERRWASDVADVRTIREDGVPADALKLSAYHPVGTHRVAGRAEDGPADPWGGVRGVDGLWVADASALPSCIGVNPQITIMAFAVRTARRIVETVGRAAN